MRRANVIAVTIACLIAGSTAWCAQDQIPWVNSWQEASAQAQRHQRLILIHFTSHNCPTCVKLERTVFNRPEVIRAIAANYVPWEVKVDNHAELARHYRVDRWPTDLIVTVDGEELYRGLSSLDSNRFISTLDQVAAHARIQMPWSGGGSATAAMPAPSRLPDRHGSEFPAGAASGAAWTPTSQALPGATSGAGMSSVPMAGDATASSAFPTHRPISGGTMVTNQFVPTGAPAAQAVREQQVSYNESTSSEFPLSGPAENATSVVPARQTFNQYVAAQPEPPADSRVAAAPDAGDASAAASPALEGYCCVTLVEQEKWVRGDARWGALHRGRTYLFAGPEEQQRFLTNFDAYAPALSGYDCVKYAEQGALVSGRRAHGVFYRGQVFLFADETALQQFWQMPERYLPLVVAERQGHTMQR